MSIPTTERIEELERRVDAAHAELEAALQADAQEFGRDFDVIDWGAMSIEDYCVLRVHWRGGYRC